MLARLLDEIVSRRRCHDRLEDHDRAVDEEAEVDGAEAHQIARDPEDVHTEERDRHRREDAKHHHEGAANGAEEQREDDGHDDGAFDEVREHRGQGSTHEIRAIVDGIDDDPGRQLALDLLHLRLHGLDDVAAVGADQHHGRARDRLPFPVARDHAVTEGGADLHLRDVAHEQRRAVCAGAKDDVGDLLLVLEEPDAHQLERLGAAIEVAAADRHVRALERSSDVLQRHLVGVEPAAIDDDVVLLEVAAHRVHLDDARHRAQLGHDLPVEDGPELRGRVLVGANDELVDLAQAARHR